MFCIKPRGQVKKTLTLHVDITWENRRKKKGGGGGGV